jgi:hypothetical protein
MGLKGKRLDTTKLKSKYFDGTADYVTDFTRSEVQKGLSATLNEEALAEVENNGYDEAEDAITNYIASTHYANYNDITNKESAKISASELVSFFIKIYEKFSNECPLALIVIVFCDYFSIEYLRLIRELPNFIQETLYKDVYHCVQDKSLLNEFFINDVDMETTNKLF